MGTGSVRKYLGLFQNVESKIPNWASGTCGLIDMSVCVISLKVKQTGLRFHDMFAFSKIFIKDLDQGALKSFKYVAEHAWGKKKEISLGILFLTDKKT